MAKAKAPKKPKKPRTLRQWLEPKLRNMARQWPEKNKARRKAVKRVQIGLYKNGKPEFRSMYECAECKKTFQKQETAADHIIPVVDPVDGFIDWNTYLERLFCPADNYQILCKPCHLLKSGGENEIRHTVKKVKRAKNT